MVDGSAGLQQILRHLPNIFNGDAFDRKRKKTGAAARNQGKQQAALFQMVELIHHLLRCFQV